MRGGKLAGFFRPAKLPPAAKLPALKTTFTLQKCAKTNKSYYPISAQSELVRVVGHYRWNKALNAANETDRLHPHPTCRHRAAVVFIAASQPDAGAALEMPPDGTWGTKIVSPALEVFLRSSSNGAATSTSLVLPPPAMRRQPPARSSTVKATLTPMVATSAHTASPQTSTRATTVSTTPRTT